MGPPKRCGRKLAKTIGAATDCRGSKDKQMAPNPISLPLVVILIDLAVGWLLAMYIRRRAGR